jgi:hypothetical protein
VRVVGGKGFCLFLFFEGRGKLEHRGRRKGQGWGRDRRGIVRGSRPGADPGLDYAIWQKRLVLEKMFPTPPCDPSTDAKSPSGFRSPYGRGCYLLPISQIKAMPLD